MDGSSLQLAIFLGSTFAAAFVAGVSGFAFALTATAIWLHIITPVQTATLIVGFGIVVQSHAVVKLRHAVRLDRIWPFLIGGAPGVALGVLVLRWAHPSSMRVGVGVLLALYAIYGLSRPKLPPVDAGRTGDTIVGFVSGLLGGMTGLAGILVVIWVSLRGWPRDQQRGVFQPASVGLFAMCALAFGLSGSIDWDTVRLFLTGLPVLLAGSWCGLHVYGRLAEVTFRRILLTLMLLSAIPLIANLR